jgi:hypothetical protein
MAWIFNLAALLNFTTTCQCHFWATISVDGFTSQINCTWMIQMTLNGVSQKQKNRASDGTLYVTPPRFASNWSAKCGSKWPTFVWTLIYHPRCIYFHVNMFLHLIVAEIWAWTGTLLLTRAWVVYGYDKLLFEGEQWGATGSDVTGSDMTGSHVTGSDASHMTGSNHGRKYIMHMCNRKLCHILPSGAFWPEVTESREWKRPCPEVSLTGSMLCACPDFSRVFFLVVEQDVTKGHLTPSEFPWVCATYYFTPLFIMKFK